MLGAAPGIWHSQPCGTRPFVDAMIGVCRAGFDSQQISNYDTGMRALASGNWRVLACVPRLNV